MGEVYLLLFQKKLLIMKNMKHFKTYLAAMALALSGCQSATDSCGTTESVSYTHLDVYKRQDYG